MGTIFLKEASGPKSVTVHIDFDDLTLAPFGYDLAKLVVSAAMTHGQLGTELIGRTLTAYNLETVDIADAHCDTDRFQLYAEIHHRLTARYIGRHSYIHAWPHVEPEPWDSTTID